MKKIIFGFLAFFGFLIGGCGPDMDIFFSITDINGNPIPSEIVFDAKSGSVTLYLNSPSTWQVTDLPNWVKMPLEGVGGFMSVNIQADENSGNERTGTITITSSGQKINITIKQEAFVPIYPASLSFLGEGGTKTFQVTTNAIWSITDNVYADWISYTPNSGNGSATISVTLKANPSSTTTRSATLTITAKGFTPITVNITQERGAVTTASQLSIDTGTLNFTAESSMKSFEITANTPWSITGHESVSSWLTVSPLSGNGNATIMVTTMANTSTTDLRNITLTISAQGVSTPLYVKVSQEKASVSPQFQIIPGSLQFSNGGGIRTIEVITNTTWYIDGLQQSDWITASPTSGNGNATVSFTAQVNPFTIAREVKFSFIPTGMSAVELVISQEKSIAILTVNTSMMNFVAEGESKSFEVTANTSWTISGLEPWLTVSPSSGTGNATVWVTVEENNATSARPASLSIASPDLTTPVSVAIQQDKSTLKSAPPWPERITNWTYNYRFDPVTYIGSVDAKAFQNRIYEKLGETGWTDLMKEDLVKLMNKALFAPGLIVYETIPYMVTNEVLCELTAWYPATTDNLTVSISQITETSVTDEIKRSAGLTIGNDNVGGISGSIEYTSSKTVTKSQGLSIESFYDLTKYEQDKKYKVVLVGTVSYGYFSFENSDVVWYYAQVDESSLRVMLVQEPN